MGFPSFLLMFLVACLLLVVLFEMRPSSYLMALSVASVHTVASTCKPTSGVSVDITWHAPKSTAINNESSLTSGTGVYGFVFNSSVTPAGVAYDTYNWCNMPHVRRQEYGIASSGYKLEYVEVVRKTNMFKS